MRTSVVTLFILLLALAPAPAAKPQSKPKPKPAPEDSPKPDAKGADATAKPAGALPGAPKLSYTLFHINTNAIALTFDDGPHVKNTPRLLQILKDRDIKATYFLIGKNVA